MIDRILILFYYSRLLLFELRALNWFLISVDHTSYRSSVSIQKKTKKVQSDHLYSCAQTQVSRLPPNYHLQLIMTHKPRNVLITGGAGFIASHVAIMLVEKYPDYKVRVSRRTTLFSSCSIKYEKEDTALTALPTIWFTCTRTVDCRNWQAWLLRQFKESRPSFGLSQLEIHQGRHLLLRSRLSHIERRKHWHSHALRSADARW